MDETWLSLTLLSPLRSRSFVRFFFHESSRPPPFLSTLNPPPLVINNRFLFLLPALWEGREGREWATPTNNSAWADIKIYQNGNAYIVNFLLARIHHCRLMTEKWWFQREFPSFFSLLSHNIRYVLDQQPLRLGWEICIDMDGPQQPIGIEYLWWSVTYLCVCLCVCVWVRKEKRKKKEEEEGRIDGLWRVYRQFIARGPSPAHSHT